MAEEAYK
jgi:hypothetical protein